MLNYSLDKPTRPLGAFAKVFDLVDSNSDKWANLTSRTQSKEMGQIFTPISMAIQLSSLIPENELVSDSQLIGDPGAGTGVLSTTLASRIHQISPTPMSVFGFETDRRLACDWDAAWDLFRQQASENVNSFLLDCFAGQAEQLLQTGVWPGLPKPDFITTNPPYIKLPKNTALSRVMSDNGIPVTNLYAAFIALASCWLKDDGHLLAILPRSFTSGDYFKSFRKWLSNIMSVEHVVLYRSRSCFKNVLQENVLVYLKKTTFQSRRVRVTVADTPTSAPEYDIILPACDTITEDGWWLPRSAADIEYININRKREHTLASLGLTLSTGKVEMHRLAGEISAPVIYSRDFDCDGNWTWCETRKPRYVKAQQRQLLSLPESGGYVVLKRISSNDGQNNQRLFPAWISRNSIEFEKVGLENHVQYLHRQGLALSEHEGKKLVAFLRTKEAQAVMRAICGTTQINKADLQKLRF